MARSLTGILLACVLLGAPVGPAAAEDAAQRAAVLARHEALSECEKLDKDDKPVEVEAPMGEGRTLYAIVCGRAAYNATFALYLVLEKGEITRLAFAEYLEELGWYGANILFNISYDQGSRMLNAFYKGRGVGDCGTKGTWRWTEYGFKLIEYRSKPDCDGKRGAWPVIFRAK